MAESYAKAWQLVTLRQNVAIWNLWRDEHREKEIDLYGADLHGAYLYEANLSEANLSGAYLYGANLHGADLYEANLNKANLSGAHLNRANLSEADLSEARLGGAYLSEADLYRADLSEADLSEADLSEADLSEADLSEADLSEANLTKAICIQTDFSRAILSDCTIYGISSWDVQLEGSTQQDLRITPRGQPAITVDNLKVAQFIYLMLNNEEIRDVIDTITSKVVLILGRFTTQRKAVLDALRDELRNHNYLPVVFDFAQPTDRTYTETVTLLARMARFIIADLTLPSSIPQELDAIVPTVIVPVQPILELGHEPWALYKDYWPYEWVLPVHRYASQDELLASIQEAVIAPAEAKVAELRNKRQQVYQPQGITPPSGAGESV